MKYIDIAQKVINYVEDNIDLNFTLEELSERYAFSMFHFNRIFRAAAGESPMEYIRLRKLDAAAESIANGRKIIEAAFESGFGSQEAFSRAFKKVYAMSPGRFAKERPGFKRYGRLDLTGFYGAPAPAEMLSAPKIAGRDEICVIGIKKLTPVKSGFKRDFMVKLWTKLRSVLEKSGMSLAGRKYCGVCACKGGDKFSYLAGITAAAEELKSMKRPFDSFSAQPLNYLETKFLGNFDELAVVHKYLYSSWLPNSDHIPSACFNIEIYGDFPLDANCRRAASSLLIPV